MQKLLNNWLFYRLGRDEYKKSIDNVFIKNIASLRRTNAVIVVLLICFMFIPLFIDKNLTKTLFFAGTIVIALSLYIFVQCKYRKKTEEKELKKNFIYFLICLTYANAVFFGIYLGVWANPEHIAGSFFAILISALLLFNIPPVFHFCLTACSTITFIIVVSIFKTAEECRLDIPNALFSCAISLVFGWHIVMNRLSLASIANKMETERNDYFDQSTVDELTQLKNRRDFMVTFQRSLTSHRPLDNFLCIAILDIDYFKEYNDYYGHPKGDDCLRKIGRTFKNLQSEMNIYAARIGGEEFALIWFEKDALNVKNVASLISEKIRGLDIPHERSSVSPYLTVSIGIYVVRCNNGYNVDNLYNLADKALYIAKRDGRNRAVINLSDHTHIELLRETA
ncbi:MAG: GGDEF domain-containing protein [Treponema sp.]|jgi:diguanylate cyclase (GGDEF)-like protein|nr:GGDEF domain-containing protein [Treponema sp.]